MTRFDLVTVAAVVAATALAASASLAMLLTLTPTANPVASADPWASAQPTTEPGGSGSELVVDVEGAVANPGIHRLPAGARVADALSAAGGYSESADLVAAAQALNLAAELVDGQQIWVPIVGAQLPGAAGAGDGLVNLNLATQRELEDLPGIGPVTAERIIAAREQQPFASLDELVSREVLTERQLEQIADLVTVP